MWYFNIGLRGDIAVVVIVIIACVPINKFVSSIEMSRICVQRGVHVFVMTGPDEMCVLVSSNSFEGPNHIRSEILGPIKFWVQKGTNECLCSARVNQILRYSRTQSSRFVIK